jgi:hypothetical protein
MYTLFGDKNVFVEAYTYNDTMRKRECNIHLKTNNKDKSQRSNSKAG